MIQQNIICFFIALQINLIRSTNLRVRVDVATNISGSIIQDLPRKSIKSVHLYRLSGIAGFQTVGAGHYFS